MIADPADDAYAGVEDLRQFSDAAVLEVYRSALLEKTWHQADFIRRHLGPGPLDVVEFASGNGRLLFTLDNWGLLASGIGLERSKSRVAFAQRWATDLKRGTRIRMSEANVLGDLGEVLGSSSADLVACITGAFGYFRPLDPIAPFALLVTMARAVRPGGHVLLELYLPGTSKSRLLEACGGHVRTWEQLPDWDPFQYYLSELEVVDEGKTLRHRKTFISRGGKIDSGRIEDLALYRLGEVETLVADAGLEVVLADGGWSGEPWVEHGSATLVVLARRPPDFY